MSRHSSGYLFVTAPSGFGKTALLANWVKALSQDNQEVCYHFISRLEDLTDNPAKEDSVMFNLCQQLIVFHGLSGIPPVRLDERRSLYLTLLETPPPEGKRLIVVLDGLDESLDWTPGPSLFPQPLPDRVFVVFSAREVSDWDWLATLELSRDAVETLHLETLGVGEIASLLEKAGEAAALQASNTKFVEKLLEVSQGDPFYLRYLVEDIMKGSIIEENVGQQPKGLKGYLKRWWSELSSDVDIKQQEAYDLLGILTVAKGPLRVKELTDISSSLSKGALLRKELDGKLRRYLIGDSQAGYALCHHRFREYLQNEVFSTKELQQYREDLLNYCAGWREHESLYALSYYPTHLFELGRASDLYALIAKAWLDEVRKQSGIYLAAADDVQLAIKMARSEQPPNLTQEMRNCPIYATLGAFTTTLPLEAFYVLARLGFVEYAQIFASLIQDNASRRQAYTSMGRGLLKRGEVKEAALILLQALAAIQANDLSELAPASAQVGERDRGLAIIESLHDGVLRMKTLRDSELSELAPALAQVGKFDLLLAAIEALKDKTLRTKTLRDSARALTEDGQLEQALVLVEAIDDKELQIKALRNMACLLAQASLPDSALQVAKQALALAETIAEQEVQAQALGYVAEALAQAGELDTAGQLAKRVLVLIAGLTREWRMMETVCTVAPVLAQLGELERVLVVAEKIAEGTIRAIVLTQATQGTKRAESQDRAQSEEFERALDVVNGTEKYATWMMAQRLTCWNLVSQVPDHGLTILRELTEDEIRTNALNWVTQTLAHAGKLPRALEATATLLAALEKIPNQANRHKALALSYVSLILAQASERARAAEVADQVFPLPARIDDDMYDFLLRGVAPAWTLIGELEKAIDVNNVMRGETEEETFLVKFKDTLFIHRRAEVLAEVARHLMRVGDFNLSLTITMIIEDPETRTDVFLDFIRVLTKVGESDRVLTYLIAIGGGIEGELAEDLPIEYRARMLASVARALVELGRHEEAEVLVSRIIALGQTLPEDASDRKHALVNIAQAFAQLGERKKATSVADSVVEALKSDLDQVPLLIKAAQVLAQLDEFDRALAVLSAIGDESKNKAYALNDLAEARAQAGDLDGALTTAEMVRDARLRANALARIAMVLARAGAQDKAVELANRALATMKEPGDRKNGNGSKKRSSVTYSPGEEELKEGSWMLSRAVQALAHADKQDDAADIAARTLIATGVAESEWIKALNLSEAMTSIQSGDKEKAMALLNQALTVAETISSNEYRKGRALRWIAQVLVLAGEFDHAVSITQNLARLADSGDTWGNAWKVDMLRGVALALSEAGQHDTATQVANLALAAVETVPEEWQWNKPSALGRVIQTLTQIGQHEQALTLWKAELAQAQLAGRWRVFNALGAGASTIAAIDHGQTLWAMYQAVIDVEDWWKTPRPA